MRKGANKDNLANNALSAITTLKGPAGQCLTTAKCAANSFLLEEV
jgi:hypothetical protein